MYNEKRKQIALKATYGKLQNLEPITKFSLGMCMATLHVRYE
jgi:hypothetical protein